MLYKKIYKWLTAFVMVFAVLATPVGVLAGSTSCGDWVTVASGDTLRKIADRCNTTVAALTLANSLSNANLIYVGQILVLPGAFLHGSGYDIYIAAHGDTLKSIATRFGTTVDILLGINPGITNANLIYAGQRINVAVPVTPPPPPSSGQIYYVQKGDTLKKIAAKFNTTVDAILQLNYIANPNVIYVGQAITLPAFISAYIVQKGDTLKIIANKYGTTVEKLLGLNPGIKDANRIYVGQIITLW